MLALGLRRHGYDVTVIAGRDAEAVRAGRLITTQCLFGKALARERELEINFWDDRAPQVWGVSFAAAGGPGATEPAIAWRAPLDQPAQAVDQRVKVADWMTEFLRLGGEIRVHRATAEDIEDYVREFELVLVAAGQGPAFERLFQRDARRSRYAEPRRAIAVFHAEPVGSEPVSAVPGLAFEVAEEGEFFRCPGLSVDGPVFGIGIFGVPGGPLDVWHGVTDIEQHFELARKLVSTYFPWSAEVFDTVRPARPDDFLHGRITPVIRHPVGTLRSGARVLAMGDAAVTNDPLSGQGANLAARAASSYQEAILEQGDRPFDEKFMHGAFARYWAQARYATRFSNDLLAPPADHVVATLLAAQTLPEVAHRLAHVIENPACYEGWLTDDQVALSYLEKAQARRRRRVSPAVG